MESASIAKYVLIGVEILFAFGLVILFHELGHFIAAKLNGVEAPEFAFGMGPEIVGVNFRGTRYKICAFPIGGYVKMVGEEDDETLEATAPRERNFRYKKPIQKISIIFAGPFMNVILAILLFASIYVIWGVPRPAPVPLTKFSKSVVVAFVDPRMAAAKGGLENGDVIVSFDGEKAGDRTKTIEYIRTHTGRKVVFKVKRAGKLKELTIAPKLNKAKKRGEIGAILTNPIPRKVESVEKGSMADKAGIVKGDVILDFGGADFSGDKYLLPVDGTELLVYRGGKELKMTLKGTAGGFVGVSLQSTVERISPFTAIKYGVQQSYISFDLMIKGIVGMIKRQESVEGVAGPIGIIQYATSFARQGIKDLINFFGFISIGLALMNLFPFPALDGSRILFHAWEAVIRRPLDPKREGLIHYIGFCALMGLILLVTLRDLRLWIGF